MSVQQPASYEAASLDGACEALVFAWGEVDAGASQRGIGIRIANFGGVRDRAATDKILSYRRNDWAVYALTNPVDSAATTMEAWRPILPYGESSHNFGAGFDVEVVSVPPGVSKLAALNTVKDLCIEAGLVDGRAFNDPAHAELPGGVDAWRATWITEGHAPLSPVSPNQVAIIATVLLLLVIAFLLYRRGH